ncbi:hypothetical protein E2C01_095375 [Portunus trituberculatus]|uniref:Uncharacterized protein n=1 Tax=Portunus trituberculatus TaxID=210409 RepID=A0A5B7K422_PORTR|nr:hypothetical protein [Portunus trituberculatus]
MQLLGCRAEPRPAYFAPPTRGRKVKASRDGRCVLLSLSRSLEGRGWVGIISAGRGAKQGPAVLPFVNPVKELGKWCSTGHAHMGCGAPQTAGAKHSSRWRPNSRRRHTPSDP